MKTKDSEEGFVKSVRAKLELAAVVRVFSFITTTAQPNMHSRAQEQKSSHRGRKLEEAKKREKEAPREIEEEKRAKKKEIGVVA